MKKYIKLLHNWFYTKNKHIYYFISYCNKYKIYNNLPSPILDVKPLLDEYANLKGSVTFVQVGSNNGISNDPIFGYIKNNNWTGILVEPIPMLFEQLVKNYEGVSNKIKFFNGAIGLERGIAKIYKVDDRLVDILPQWCFQLASFKKEVIMSHAKYDSRIKESIIEEIVPMLKLNDLLDESNIQSLNLLHIDTEGYDFEILKTFNFEKFNPDIILFEHRHLTIHDFKECKILINNKGYNMFSTEHDTICLNNKSNNYISINQIKLPFYFKNYF